MKMKMKADTATIIRARRSGSRLLSVYQIDGGAVVGEYRTVDPGKAFFDGLRFERISA